ncbi:hypothetical protein APHAL10511_000610 [Amanita phalloides]|nr:hypothetical protein APHAL10511_000610 [Amanita phalloides]
MTPRLLQLLLLAATALWAEAADLPPKVYGVNLGSWYSSWLLIEPWMVDGVSAASFATIVQTASPRVALHSVIEAFCPRNTWFNNSDVQQLVSAGINTVRIPLGYWIVEPLVDRTTEYYVRGGFVQLIRGLGLLKDADIVAILELHGAPGVQVPDQPFTGLCTGNVEFYTQYNYHRALIWTAVLTTFNHLVPEFSNVVAIQAVNEPLMDAALTPDYGTYQTHFVQVVRAVEHALGLSVPKLNLPKPNPHLNVTAAFEFAIQQGVYDAEECWGSISSSSPTPLITTFMDFSWQSNHPSNPADAAIGSQLYDNHLYLSFGVRVTYSWLQLVSSWMEHYKCRSDVVPDLRVQVTRDAQVGNTPLVFGEWSLTTGFIASDSFLRQWADAQKLAYSQGRGLDVLEF